MHNIIIISIGAIFGALLRWLISSKLNHTIIYNESFPLGTFIVNIIGCYIIGFIAFMISNNEIRLFFIVGFLGSFTTFSAFSLESFEFLRNGKFILFFINYFINSLGSIFFATLGYYSFTLIKKFL